MQERADALGSASPMPSYARRATHLATRFDARRATRFASRFDAAHRSLNDFKKKNPFESALKGISRFMGLRGLFGEEGAGKGAHVVGR